MVKMKENYLSHSKKETTTRQPTKFFTLCFAWGGLKNGEKCLNECNNLSWNSVLYEHDSCSITTTNQK